MPTMREFLEAVLPAEGRYCLVALDPEHKLKRQEFTNSLAKLEQRIKYWDGYFEGSHGAVYHACAAFDARNRLQTNVRAVRSLWLDIDVGKPGAYATFNDALTELAVFVGRVGLPLPLVVASGSGVHAYWPLSEALTRETWQVYADGLKAACSAHNLLADPTRTADPSSILRSPGTTNRKSTPVMVECGALLGPYGLGDFSSLLGGASGGERSHAPVRKSTARTVNGKPQSELLRRLLNVTTPERIDFSDLARSCAQLGEFERSRGNIPEPEWYAGIGALAWCYEGDRVVHEWSSGHPQYTFEETADRLRRVRQLSGPTTCAKFKSLNKLCEGCPFYDTATTPLDSVRSVAQPISSPPWNDYRAGAQGPPETPVDPFVDG